MSFVKLLRTHRRDLFGFDSKSDSVILPLSVVTYLRRHRQRTTWSVTTRGPQDQLLPHELSGPGQQHHLQLIGADLRVGV